jgi:hypothetical protein
MLKDDSLMILAMKLTAISQKIAKLIDVLGKDNTALHCAVHDLLQFYQSERQ